MKIVYLQFFSLFLLFSFALDSNSGTTLDKDAVDQYSNPQNEQYAGNSHNQISENWTSPAVHDSTVMAFTKKSTVNTSTTNDATNEVNSSTSAGSKTVVGATENQAVITFKSLLLQCVKNDVHGENKEVPEECKIIKIYSNSSIDDFMEQNKSELLNDMSRSNIEQFSLYINRLMKLQARNQMTDHNESPAVDNNDKVSPTSYKKPKSFCPCNIFHKIQIAKSTVVEMYKSISKERMLSFFFKEDWPIIYSRMAYFIQFIMSYSVTFMVLKTSGFMLKMLIKYVY